VLLTIHWISKCGGQSPWIHILVPTCQHAFCILFFAICARRAGHVTRMGEMRNAYKILVGKSEGKDHSEDLDVYGKIILER